MRLAALTMIFNEPVWAPVWVRHYARQVGQENCFVLDHGSTDGSTAGLGVQVELVERTSLDERARAALVSARVAALLNEYDAVVHSDADELVIADPGRYADLRAFAADAPDVATMIGLDLQHLPEEEEALETWKPIGAQRQWARFSAAMCKPAFVRRAVRWQAGFHGCDAAPCFAPAFLVHLRYADLGLGLARLERTRGLTFSDPQTNLHQRVSDREFEGMVRAIAQLPRKSGSLDMASGLIAPWLSTMRSGWARGDMQLSVAGDALWQLPAPMLATL